MYAPHRTIPHQVKYSTALTEKAECFRQISLTSINRMWYFVFKMGMPIIKYIEFSEKVA